MFCTSRQTTKSSKLPKNVENARKGNAPSDTCSVASFWWDPNHTDIYMDSVQVLEYSTYGLDLSKFDPDSTMENAPDLIPTDIDMDRPCDTDVSISAGDKYTTSMDTILEGMAGFVFGCVCCLQGFIEGRWARSRKMMVLDDDSFNSTLPGIVMDVLLWQGFILLLKTGSTVGQPAPKLRYEKCGCPRIW